MLTIDHCPACKSLDVKKIPFKLSQFVSWMATGEFTYENVPISAIVCNACTFVGSGSRFTQEEEDRLYHDYQGEDYTNKRSFCEPWYKEYITNFDNNKYAADRRIGINHLIDKHIDILKINTVVDIGGGDGRHIPISLIKAKRYVLDPATKSIQSGILQFDPRTNKTPMDFVMCCNELEHASDPDQFMRNIRKLITPDTWLYIEVPNFDIPKDTFHERLNIWSLKSLEVFLGRHHIGIIDHKITSVVGTDTLCLLTRLK